MKPGRLIALIVRYLLVSPGITLLLGGFGLGAAYVLDRDDAGYITTTVDRLESQTAAITAGDLDLVTDPGSPDWLLDRLDADVRFAVVPAGPGDPLFVGIGPAADVDAYLAGVAHDEVVDVIGARRTTAVAPVRLRSIRPVSGASGPSPRPVPAPCASTGPPRAAGGRWCS